MVKIENNQECFVKLWLRLERTRRLFGGQCKRFCIRNVLKAWFGGEATDNFIWEVCHLCEQEGWNELPLPSLYPRKHRELLRAIVAVRTGISFWKINLKVLDAAYSEAFPHSTPLNVNKKRKVNYTLNIKH
ncbi:hypothetical protein [Prevotella sp. RM4]|uniref:hypothetical protein n=1 Tax=Prevotella sp. RM4 TaxID=1200547 RepID=UPI0012ED399B|nr:hypothetical protein [Prevotella sp. RM4]